MFPIRLARIPPLLATTLAFHFADPGAAALLRVGPGGDHATIQAALDAALLTAESDEIRVRAATYPENLDLPSFSDTHAIDLSGGWDAAFTVRDPDPATTTVDGGGTDRAFNAEILAASAVTVRGLTLTNGSSSSAGAGMRLILAGTSRLRLEQCHFHGNTVASSDAVLGAAGGGLFASVGDDAELALVDVEWTDNAAVLAISAGAARGGGAHLLTSETARATIRGARLVGNQIAGGAQLSGAGLRLAAEDSSEIVLEDSLFSGNFGASWTNGAALSAFALDEGSVAIARLAVFDNQLQPGDDSRQIYLRTFPRGGSIRFTDSWIAGGGDGLRAELESGVGQFLHLTATGHEAIGISLSSTGGATVSIANSIAWNNAAADLVGNATQVSNLVGVDPLFVDPLNGDFRLGPTSPARDSGHASPPGGLGPYDADHAPRVAGTAPDRGAFERGGLFADGFESADTSAWSN